MRKENVAYTKVLHVIVAEAFLGPRPPGMQIDHVDGDKLNNRATNFEYVTPIENVRRARAMGLIGDQRRENTKGYMILPNGRYWARITIGQKHIALGTYDNAWDATNAYEEALNKI